MCIRDSRVSLLPWTHYVAVSRRRRSHGHPQLVMRKSSECPTMTERLGAKPRPSGPAADPLRDTEGSNHASCERTHLPPMVTGDLAVALPKRPTGRSCGCPGSVDRPAPRARPQGEWDRRIDNRDDDVWL